MTTPPNKPKTAVEIAAAKKAAAKIEAASAGIPQAQVSAKTAGTPPPAQRAAAVKANAAPPNPTATVKQAAQPTKTPATSKPAATPKSAKPNAKPPAAPSSAVPMAKPTPPPTPAPPVNLAKKWSAKMHVGLGLFALALLVGGFGTWSVFSNIAGAIIATGQIELEQNRQVIQHPDGGVVETVTVREGDSVDAGEVLIKLDSRRLNSELLIIEGELFEIVSRSARLEAERDDANAIKFPPMLVNGASDRNEITDLMQGQERLFQARLNNAKQTVEQLQKRKSQISSQVEGIRAQQDALVTQLGLLKEELDAQQDLLAKGLAQAGRVLALQREDARLLGQVGELTASVAESEGRITEIDIQILQLSTQRKEEAITQLRDLQYRQFELSEQRIALKDQMSRLDITAPVSGLVFGLTVFAERSVIRPADDLMFLVPQDRPLVITGQIEPIHIEEVYIGQDATMRFSTFDARQTPEVFGTVHNISGDAFTDEQNGRRYYRIELVLNPGEMERLGDVILLPGMPVDTFIQTSERSPMAYFVKPLADYFNKAFRES
ncbi:MAG: HlyD family type I secretion periplasmic adaptor subunit [Litoreibacter sp.]